MVSPVQPPAIVPAPVRMTRSDGTFPISPDTRLYADDAAVADLFRTLVGAPIGVPLEPAGEPASNVVSLRLDTDRTDLKAEGYQLTVEPDRVTAVAASAAGLRWAVQTMRQLAPAEIFAAAPGNGVKWEMPCVDIVDVPRFAWRGAMLDVARWFQPLPFLYRFIDLAAMHKLNVVHLHLTDDQGWRFECRRYPRLTDIGAWRKESMSGHYRDQSFDGKPHGGFYSQDDLRDLVRFAKERGITLVPEIDMPGHMRAAIAAYPELGNFPSHPVEVATGWGIHDEVLNPELRTVQFCTDVLTEVLDIFDSEYVHIGGDECPKTEWKRSARAQQLIAERGLADEDELQSWFVRQVTDFLAENGRRMIGWDEILEGGLADGAVVMSWRSEEGGITAAGLGHDVVMAPSQRVYFDYYQADPDGEPVAIGGHTTLESVRAYEPVPAAIADHPERVLGTQCQLWTEYMPVPEHVEYMAFPRVCAFAEVAWGSDAAGFEDRLGDQLTRLDAMGVNYRKSR
ncbi:beta-N-acetylhexosaminidase [Fodinicola acaciae]|uniref:beta-N-acetylhexosaminidase n=1 Tax=Fodinicola acaciae TaxID=2681555 RepID=UPI0013D5FF7C|nr:beta-N-acetylhexosaminidase [Fodinicola acaciae]